MTDESKMSSSQRGLPLREGSWTEEGGRAVTDDMRGEVGEVAEPYVAAELSRSYADILGGTVPREVDVFLILWQDRDSDRFLSWGTYLSTSEPPPHPGKVDAFVALQCRMPLPKRTTDDLAVAIARAKVLCEEKFFRTGKYAQLVLKLMEDLEPERARRRTSSAVVTLPDREYERVTGRKVLT